MWGPVAEMACDIRKALVNLTWPTWPLSKGDGVQVCMFISSEMAVKQEARPSDSMEPNLHGLLHFPDVVGSLIDCLPGQSSSPELSLLYMVQAPYLMGLRCMQVHCIMVQWLVKEKGQALLQWNVASDVCGP